MKQRTGFSRRNMPDLPIAWRVAERAMLRTNASDTCDARVSEDIFELEDERTAVDLMVHSMNYQMN